MVSTNQSNTSGEAFETEAERFLSSDMELAPLIRGIESEERVLEFWNAVNRLDVSDKRYGMVRQRMEHLRE